MRKAFIPFTFAFEFNLRLRHMTSIPSIDPPYLTQEAIDQFIQAALQEDIGPGDYSSLSAVPANLNSKAVLKVKDSGILAGVRLAEKIFKAVHPDLHMEVRLTDGQPIEPGQEAFFISGPAQAILSAERLVLNCMQRMSGIATKTHGLQSLIAHTRAKVLDTRKTTPNSRLIEKWAVLIGGGQNHRFALYDMIMLKDNHIDYAGGIENALRAARAFLQKNNLDLKIEVETRNLEEVKVAFQTGIPDYIMLDNFTLEQTRDAVEWIGGRVPLEASGNINEKTIAAVAETGVDFISVGALTHSYKSLDLSLKAVAV